VLRRPRWVAGEQERKAFFSEEKKKKTSNSVARGKIPAMASNVGAAEEQKSFGSFLQKRRYLA
jgi:hypothetical protein